MSDVSNWIAAGSVVVALVSAVYAGRNSQRATNVDEEMTEIERVKDLRADAAGARKDARSAWDEATQARAIAGEAHRRADEVVSYLGWVLRIIHDPTMTMETLRAQLRDSVPPAGVGHGAGFPRKEWS